MAFLCQVEEEQGGCKVCMAQVTRNSAEVDASCEHVGGIGLAERMASDVAFDEASPLGSWAESALATALQRGKHLLMQGGQEISPCVS